MWDPADDALSDVDGSVGQRARLHALKSMRERPEWAGGRTPFEAYFAAAPLSAEQPTLLFQHLQKTGGTALRRVIHAGLVGEDAEAGEVETSCSTCRRTITRTTPSSRTGTSNGVSSLDRDRRDHLILDTSLSAKLHPRPDRETQPRLHDPPGARGSGALSLLLLQETAAVDARGALLAVRPTCGRLARSSSTTSRGPCSSRTSTSRATTWR